MESLKYCMLAVLVLALSQILRQTKSELLPALRIGAILLFGMAALQAAEPIVTYLKSLAELGGISHYLPLLFKALGIALLAEICVSVCRQSGEESAAMGVEWICRVELLLLSLPLMSELLDLVRQLLELGGDV